MGDLITQVNDMAAGSIHCTQGFTFSLEGPSPTYQRQNLRNIPPPYGQTRILSTKMNFMLTRSSRVSPLENLSVAISTNSTSLASSNSWLRWIACIGGEGPGMRAAHNRQSHLHCHCCHCCPDRPSRSQWRTLAQRNTEKER